MAILGPPELQNPSKPQPQDASQTSDPFMDLMVSKFNNTPGLGSARLQMGQTENYSATYLSTGNPCLDFFFHVVPNSPANEINSMLQQAWDFDALTTLKLICNLRGVRGTGKSDKEGFYTAALWLHGLHPKTLACNIPVLAEFGYFKDFPELLYRLLEGGDIRYRRRMEWKQRRLGKRARSPGRFLGMRGGRRRAPFEPKKEHGRKGTKGGRGLALTQELRISNALKRSKAEKEVASKKREEKKVAMAKKALMRYTHDPDYRFLHDRVSDFFAGKLRSDMEWLNSGKLTQISLAAKWCPSIDSAFDKATLLCESIARRVFPREEYKEYEMIEEAHYAYRVRDRLRKEVLVPLHKVLELPEVYIGANSWDTLPYNRVASVAMKFYKEKFVKHDGERFAKYLEDVKSGKVKIAAGALLPHEILLALNDGEGDGGQVAELQWKRMVEDLLAKGKLKNCLAICDVSGSMAGTPMEVSVALGVLVSELSEEPWKGNLISFSENPKLQKVEGESLMEKTLFVRGMDCGMNTDFQKVFDLILDVAVNGKLKEEDMIKRVFVFSDMEFDQASANPWETDYQVIVRKFSEKGYGNSVPEMVFWNLRSSRSTPVPTTQKGVALVSGFSKNLMKLFLDGDGELNPEAVMQAAISGEEYQKLMVLD